jgi:hypothetical protein
VSEPNTAMLVQGHNQLNCDSIRVDVWRMNGLHILNHIDVVVYPGHRPVRLRPSARADGTVVLVEIPVMDSTGGLHGNHGGFPRALCGPPSTKGGPGNGQD